MNKTLNFRKYSKHGVCGKSVEIPTVTKTVYSTPIVTTATILKVQTIHLMFVNFDQVVKNIYQIDPGRYR